MTSKKLEFFLISFAVIMPTFNGIIGVLVATAMGLSLGGAVMFGLLLASASFIAAPCQYYVMQYLRQTLVYISHPHWELHSHTISLSYCQSCLLSLLLYTIQKDR